MTDIVDEELMRAERDASPQRFPRRPSDEIERIITASSVASSSSSSSAIDHDHVSNAFRRHLSRVTTQQDLERHPTALSRIATHRTQHGSTVGADLKSATSTRQSKKPLPAFGAGKPYPPTLPAQEEYVVEFDGPDDPTHSQNWPFRKKMLTSAMLAFTTFTATFTSSIFSEATLPISKHFHVGLEVSLLGTSFYVLGFAFGPSLWAPMSELQGRKLPIVIGMFGFSLFTIATATAKDIQTVLLCRFFAGFFGACPLAVVAAVFSDLFDNKSRGIAITMFSICVFSAPFMAPFIGGFIVDSYLGWRWTEYVPAILGFTAFAADLFFLEETYPPVILVAKAADLRRRTKNWGIHAKQEEIEVDFRELMTKNLTRPIRILFTEPIVLLLSIYMSFIYGLLYLSLGSYPLIFSGVHGFKPGQAGLCFFGMVIGQLLAGGLVIAQQPWYLRKLQANNGVPVPEWRLPSMMLGGICFTIGLFWFGWTGYTRSISWVAPAASGIFTGFGIMSIFLQGLNYIIDAYLMFAASAIAGNTFMRSLAGAAFPLFTRQMFNGMGIQWAGTLLGCLSLVMAPIPFIFYFYGLKIRQKSKFAPTRPMGPPPPAAEDSNGLIKEEEEADGATGEKVLEEQESPAEQAALGSVPRKEEDLEAGMAAGLRA